MRWLTVGVPGDTGREILLEMPGPPSVDNQAADQIRGLITKGATGFTVGFTTDNGVRVAGPNTRFAGVDTGLLHGDGYVDYITDRLALMPGTWHLTVAVVDETMLHTYDHLDQVYQFHVQPGSSYERFGIVDLHGRWHVGT